MNKTVTINISGIIFHIEEDAYEKLSRYLATIKGYFRDSDGRDEIMADIEARIAEMLQEKVGKSKQVVLMADVDQVIAVMGQPEEFAAGTDDSYREEKTEETKEAYTGTKRRRIFRDPDERVLGGVCSGLGSYFNFDPVWLRIAFAVAFFAFGSGLLFYILLWIIIPQARTTAEKLEMRGENVNVNNISRSVNEEMEHVRKRMENLGKDLGSKENRARVRNGLDQVLAVIANIFRATGKVLAIFFVIIGSILLIVLLSTLFGVNDINVYHRGEHISFSLHDAMMVIFTNSSQADLAMTGLILLIGIPLIALIYLGIRLLFKVKQTKRIVKITLFALWVVGWVLLAIAGAQVSKEFDEHNTSKQVITLKQPVGGTLFLQMKNDSKYDYSAGKIYDSRVMIDDWNLVRTDDKTIAFGSPYLDIVESETDSFELVIVKSADGINKKGALDRAKSINYLFTQNDSLLELNPYYDIDNETKFRGQGVKLILKVPKGKTVFIGRSMRGTLYDVSNMRNAWDGDMVNRRWTMTPEGLDCMDCQGLDDDPHKIGIHSYEGHDPSLPPTPPPPPAPPVDGNEKDKR
jgi:phage shock protein PspC (stress-responsive transcriptional regulator)